MSNPVAMWPAVPRIVGCAGEAGDVLLAARQASSPVPGRPPGHLHRPAGQVGSAPAGNPPNARNKCKGNRESCSGRRRGTMRWVVLPNHELPAPTMRHTKTPLPAPPAAAAASARRPGRGRKLECPQCGRVEERSLDEIRRLVSGGWPECCGWLMPPAGPAGRKVVVRPYFRRRGRRPARPGARAEIWRAAAPTRDVGLGIVNVSACGAQVRLQVAALPGELVEIALSPPGAAPAAARGPAAVRWCRGLPDGAFLAGLRFPRLLGPEALAALAG